MIFLNLKPGGAVIKRKDIDRRRVLGVLGIACMLTCLGLLYPRTSMYSLSAPSRELRLWIRQSQAATKRWPSDPSALAGRLQDKLRSRRIDFKLLGITEGSALYELTRRRTSLWLFEVQDKTELKITP